MRTPVGLAMDRAVCVNGRDDLSHLGDSERVRLSTRCRAHDPAESTTNTAYDDMDVGSDKHW